MGTIPAGFTTALPDQPGRWQAWSPADHSPGSYFFVPSDDDARESGIKYLVVRVKYPRTAAKPDFKVLQSVTF